MTTGNIVWRGDFFRVFLVGLFSVFFFFVTNGQSNASLEAEGPSEIQKNVPKSNKEYKEGYINKTEINVSAKSDVSLFISGVSYGIILLAGLLFGLLYFYSSNSNALFYIILLVGYALYSLVFDGFGERLIWGEDLALRITMQDFFIPAYFVIVWSVYVRKSRSSNLSWSISEQFLRVSTIVVVTYLLVAVIFLPDEWRFDYVVLLPFIGELVTSVHHSIKLNKQWPLRLLSVALLTSSLLLLFLQRDGYIEPSYLVEDLFKLSLVIDITWKGVVFLIPVFGLKSEVSRLESELKSSLTEQSRIRDEVDLELSKRVAERVDELNKANEELKSNNQKLASMTDEAYHMSAQLDKELWRLKKDTEEIHLERITDKILSYEEFQHVFGDDVACKKFLMKKKWENGYSCQKCGNTKSMNSADKYVKKCTKCTFPESVTAYTLFHGVRFPLPKAFYLTYLFFRAGQELNITKTAELIGVRKNTCSLFRTKVSEAVDKKEGDGIQLESWLDILV